MRSCCHESSINGAGIAGTTLAYWLRQFGHDVLLVEQAPQLRSGGYVLDLWGIGYDIAERMDVIPRLRESEYRIDELRFEDEQGRTCGGYSARIYPQLTDGRFLPVARSDIAAAIFGVLDDGIETVFGDTVTSIVDDVNGVQVGFEQTPTQEADLVIGADGLHSRVRELAFGPETGCEFSLGCHVACFEVDGYRPRDEHVYVMHGAPGRGISRFPLRDDRTLFFMFFRDEYLDGVPVSTQKRKSALQAMYADMGWECPQILSSLDGVDDLYFDSISQIRMPHWAKGRTALVGDAAACPSLIAGEGAGLAIIEAYVVAGEIHKSQQNYGAAFSRYEERLQTFLANKQKYAAKLVPLFVPRTAFGIRLRNFQSRLMRLPGVPKLLAGRFLRDDITLPGYS